MRLIGRPGHVRQSGNSARLGARQKERSCSQLTENERRIEIYNAFVPTLEIGCSIMMGWYEKRWY